ncbi:hypothetical protein FACS189440_20290 [Bacteroidia bacterium]|nr:hypothetical protein FACS189440_20290 [Bacteroidia bacterium]
MGISEKIIHSDAFHVNIYKEGAFWIAYEQSAYFFYVQKGYKPTKKFIKCIGQEVVSIGFPENALVGAKHLSPLPERDEAGVKTFLLEYAIDMNDFADWKEQIPVRDRDEKCFAPTTDIAAMIRDFPLADSTPMECMLFISELKKLK